MDKEVTQVVAGVGVAKAMQAIMRRYVDNPVAQMLLYTSTQYAVDLKAAGYVVQGADATKSDAEIGNLIVSSTGYVFASGPANLRGSAKLTADIFTYQAAAGQKVKPYMFPSTWLSAIVGGVGVAEGHGNYLGGTFTRDNKIAVTAFGASLLGDGVVRGIGVDGTITAPSGFDVSKQPAMQYLDPNAMANLTRLAQENTRLQGELNQLRAATGRPQITVTSPMVQVSEVIPSKGAELIKERTHMMGSGMFRATAENVRNQTGLVTLTGGK